jgi:hypothetical protein
MTLIRKAQSFDGLFSAHVDSGCLPCFSNFARLYNISTRYRRKIKGKANLALPGIKKE